MIGEFRPSGQYGWKRYRSVEATPVVQQEKSVEVSYYDTFLRLRQHIDDMSTSQAVWHDRLVANPKDEYRIENEREELVYRNRKACADMFSALRISSTQELADVTASVSDVLLDGSHTAKNFVG